jgi:5-methylcytosine-specific restriction endonuclease McrBC regulatory subunit McrC
MVNPLARIVMENVSRKIIDDKNIRYKDNNFNIENLSNKDKELIKDIINKSNKNEGNISVRNTSRKNMVTLDQVAKSIKEKGN